MFGVGELSGVGTPLSPNRIGGENFIRHIGNDKLIYNFKSGSGTTVKDRSREGNDGTFGATTTAPTWKRNSLYFDGGDHVKLTGYSHGITTGGLTLCFSVDSLAAGDIIYGQETVLFYTYGLDDDSKISFSNKVLTDDVSSNKPLIYQITRDNSGNLECYVNGKASGKAQSLTTDYTYDGTSKAKLGASYLPSVNIVSTMYSFRMMNKGLSGIEAQQEYLSQKFRGNN